MTMNMEKDPIFDPEHVDIENNPDFCNELLEEIAKPQYYNNRELSWLAFNERVLEEAEDTNNPLLERMKFLAIFSSNLDEFFMVRVAGLQDQIRAGYHKPENKSGLTPKEQLAKIAERTQALVRRQTEVYRHLVHELLPKEHVHIIDLKMLNEQEKVISMNCLKKQSFLFLHQLRLMPTVRFLHYWDVRSTCLSCWKTTVRTRKIVWIK